MMLSIHMLLAIRAALRAVLVRVFRFDPLPLSTECRLMRDSRIVVNTDIVGELLDSAGAGWAVSMVLRDPS
jgi:hypothetical protein